jgi:DNA repair exonuclease SbcCD ATPase subunit
MPKDLQALYDYIQDGITPEEFEELEKDIINKHNAQKSEIPPKETAEQADNSETVNSETANAETVLETANAETAPITEIITPIEKDGFLVKTAKKFYDKRAKKQQSKITAAENKIKILEYEKSELEKQADDMREKCNKKKGEIIGLTNANTFIEASNIGGIAGKILNFTANANNKKILKIQSEIKVLVSKINKLSDKIKSLINDISKLENTIPDYHRAAEKITAKQNNLDKLKTFPNPLAGILMNMKSPQIAVDLEQFCYKKITQAQMDKLQQANLEGKYKRADSLYIIKFPKMDLEQFNSVLEGKK